METEDHEDALLEAEQINFIERYSPLGVTDVISGKISPPPWLFGPLNPLDDNGLLRSKTITMLSAEPFTGKTMLMLALTLGLSSRHPLLGHQAQPDHRVLFLGQDAPTWDYWGQIRKLWTGLGKPAIPAGSALFFLNRGWRLADPGFDRFLSEAMSLFGITVLMLDTLLQFHTAEENSNKEMRAVMDFLKSWRDKGLTIIFSHHTSKAPQNSGNYSARGASVISGSVDFHLQLSSRGSIISLGLPKRRGGAKRASTDGFALIDTADGGIILEPRAAAPAAGTQVLSYLTTARTLDDVRAYLASQFPGDLASLDGRLHGVLGALRRKHRIMDLPDGRMVATKPPLQFPAGKEKP